MISASDIVSGKPGVRSDIAERIQFFAEEVEGFALAMSKLVLTGRVAEVVDTACRFRTAP
jgi:hypothetical protein